MTNLLDAIGPLITLFVVLSMGGVLMLIDALVAGWWHSRKKNKETKR